MLIGTNVTPRTTEYTATIRAAFRIPTAPNEVPGEMCDISLLLLLLLVRRAKVRKFEEAITTPYSTGDRLRTGFVSACGRD